MSAKRDPLQLLRDVSLLAAGLFRSRQIHDVLPERIARLTEMVNQAPFAIGLMDSTGTWMIMNAAMERFVPEQIPSQDPKRIQRWRAIDAENGLLHPTRWPSARALRGESVTPGVRFNYTTDEGYQVATRVAAIPVRDASGKIAGAVAMIVEIETSPHQTV